MANTSARLVRKACQIASPCRCGSIPTPAGYGINVSLGQSSVLGPLGRESEQSVLDALGQALLGREPGQAVLDALGQALVLALLGREPEQVVLYALGRGSQQLAASLSIALGSWGNTT